MEDVVEKEQFDRVVSLTAQLLYELGLDGLDPNFKDTPTRYAKVLLGFTQSAHSVKIAVAELSRAVFPSVQDELVALGNIRVYGLCPHHCTPIFYRVAVGYIPSGLVLGLSKFPRLVKSWAKVLLLQEDFTVNVRDSLKELLRTQHVGVIVEGRHLCMEMRGVEQDQVKTVTSSLSGAFLEPGVKREFMELGGVGKGDW